MQHSYAILSHHTPTKLNAVGYSLSDFTHKTLLWCVTTQRDIVAPVAPTIIRAVAWQKSL